MSVRWIGDAARELSIEVWDAIALLSKEDEYPMNGLLDEERFQVLKRAAKKGVEASSPSAAAALVPPPLPRLAEVPAPREQTEVTAPMPNEKSEAKTVIYPPG